MYIYGASYVHGPQNISAPHRSAAPQGAAPRSARGADQLDISPEANYVSRTRDIPEIRADRVAEIRAQIASGAYETPEKIDIALERLLDEIGG